jgi:UDP-glucose 4-epimerase
LVSARSAWEPFSNFGSRVGGTLAARRAMTSQDRSPGRLVVASTCAVYGERAPQPITENAVPEPSNPYGASKLAADRAVADVAVTAFLSAVGRDCVVLSSTAASAGSAPRAADMALLPPCTAKPLPLTG